VGVLADSLGVKLPKRRDTSLKSLIEKGPKARRNDPSTGSISDVPTKDSSLAPFARWAARKVEQGATALGVPEKTAAKAASYLYDPLGGWDAYDFSALPFAATLGEYGAHKALGIEGGPSGLDTSIEATANLLPLALGPLASGGKRVLRRLLHSGADAVEDVARFAVHDAGDLKTVIPTHAQPQIVPEVADAPNIDAIRAIIADPEKNQPLRVAQDYTLGNYDHNMPAPKTSLEKQSGIARVFQHAQEDDPAYKHALFERYGEMYPQMMDRLGVQNADQLLERSYSALQDEAGQQFKRLPVSMQYHFGSGEYPTPSAMMRDVYGNGNLNVFRGGDRHDFLNAVDPETGLNSNEMFRAVHDYFGHALNGSTFRPGGEEAAYASHWQMLSPEARIALLAETRGQNSFVNYSPINADILGPMRGAQHKLDERASLLRRYNGGEPYPYLLEDAKALGDPEELRAIVAKYANSPDFQFAPQKAVLLPPEYIPPDTAGGVPDYLQPLIQPKAPVDNVRGVHFSNAGPDLTELDPSFIGTGHKGREYPWIGKLGSPDRTYFYTGEPGTVGMEDALLQRRGDLRSVYEGELNGLYDTVADPEGLAKLVNAYDFGSPEGVRGAQLDRLIKEYGYQGYTGKVGDKPAAASYRKTKVRKLADQAGDRKYAQGGLVS
jgi:hypothetical protein